MVGPLRTPAPEADFAEWAEAQAVPPRTRAAVLAARRSWALGLALAGVAAGLLIYGIERVSRARAARAGRLAAR